MDVQQFMEYIENYVSNKFDAQICDFSPEEIGQISELSDEKYSTWEWNFGRSKEFVADKKKRYDFGSVRVGLTAENGLIKDIKITGDFFGVRDITEVEKVLIGCRLEKRELLAGLTNMPSQLCE